MSYSVKEVKKFVEAIFKRFDKDNSNDLDQE